MQAPALQSEPAAHEAFEVHCAPNSQTPLVQTSPLKQSRSLAQLEVGEMQRPAEQV